MLGKMPVTGVTMFVMICLFIVMQVMMFRNGYKEGFLIDTSGAPGANIGAVPNGEAVDMSQYVLKTEVPKICAMYNRDKPNAPFPSIAQLVRRAEAAEASGYYPPQL
jgi:hypothetical protein